MIAVWPDGTKDPVYEYTLRDKMAADESKKTDDKHASASCPVLAEFKRPAFEKEPELTVKVKKEALSANN